MGFYKTVFALIGSAGIAVSSALAQIPDRPDLDIPDPRDIKPPEEGGFPDMLNPDGAANLAEQLFYQRCAAVPASCVWIVPGYENRIVNHTRQGVEGRRDTSTRSCFNQGVCRHASTQVRVLNMTGAAAKTSIYKSNRLFGSDLVLATEFDSDAGEEVRDHLYTDFNKFILNEARPESGWLAIFSTQPVLVSANVRMVEVAAEGLPNETKDQKDALGYNTLKAFPVDCSSDVVFTKVCDLFESERERFSNANNP